MPPASTGAVPRGRGSGAAASAPRDPLTPSPRCPVCKRLLLRHPRANSLVRGCAFTRQPRSPVPAGAGLILPPLPKSGAGAWGTAQPQPGEPKIMGLGSGSNPQPLLPGSTSCGHRLTRDELVQVHLLAVVFVHVQHEEA